MRLQFCCSGSHINFNYTFTCSYCIPKTGIHSLGASKFANLALLGFSQQRKSCINHWKLLNIKRMRVCYCINVSTFSLFSLILCFLTSSVFFQPRLSHLLHEEEGTERPGVPRQDHSTLWSSVVADRSSDLCQDHGKRWSSVVADRSSDLGQDHSRLRSSVVADRSSNLWQDHSTLWSSMVADGSNDM